MTPSVIANLITEDLKINNGLKLNESKRQSLPVNNLRLAILKEYENFKKKCEVNNEYREVQGCKECNYEQQSGDFCTQCGAKLSMLRYLISGAQTRICVYHTGESPNLRICDNDTITNEVIGKVPAYEVEVFCHFKNNKEYIYQLVLEFYEELSRIGKNYGWTMLDMATAGISKPGINLVHSGKYECFEIGVNFICNYTAIVKPRPDKIFHITHKDKLKSIIGHGIRPTACKYGYYMPRAYFLLSLDDAIFYLNLHYAGLSGGAFSRGYNRSIDVPKDDFAILQCDTSKVRGNFYHDFQSDESLRAIWTYAHIPSEVIVAIYDCAGKRMNL